MLKHMSGDTHMGEVVETFTWLSRGDTHLGGEAEN